MKNQFFFNKLMVAAILSFLFINCDRDYELEGNKPSKPENNIKKRGFENEKTDKKLKYKPNELIVVFKDKPTKESRNKIKSKLLKANINLDDLIIKKCTSSGGIYMEFWSAPAIDIYLKKNGKKSANDKDDQTCQECTCLTEIIVKTCCGGQPVDNDPYPLILHSDANVKLQQFH